MLKIFGSIRTIADNRGMDNCENQMIVWIDSEVLLASRYYLMLAGSTHVNYINAVFNDVDLNFTPQGNNENVQVDKRWENELLIC